MKMILIAVFLVSSLLAVSIALADVPVVVKIKPVLLSTVDYYDYLQSVESGYQRFRTTIYNIGSIGCMTRIRFDIYNSSDNSLVHSSWSGMLPIEAGGTGDFEAYWYPFNISGDFNSRMRIYQCNDILEGSSSDFTVRNIVDNKTMKVDPIEKKILEIRKVSNTENEILFEIRSNADFGEIIMSPAEYFPGWIFDSIKIDSIKNGEIKYIKLNYEPSIWKESTIVMNIFDADNNYFSTVEYSIEKNNEINIKDIIIAMLGIFLFIIIFLNIRQIKKKKRKINKNNSAFFKAFSFFKK